MLEAKHKKHLIKDVYEGQTENLIGGESYEEAYVKSYGEGGITGEGEALSLIHI